VISLALFIGEYSEMCVEEIIYLAAFIIKDKYVDICASDGR
jgi:hypothetical protein